MPLYINMNASDTNSPGTLYKDKSWTQCLTKPIKNEEKQYLLMFPEGCQESVPPYPNLSLD